MTFSELLEEHKVSLENKIKEEFPYGHSRYETEGLSENQTKNFLEFIEENKNNKELGAFYTPIDNLMLK